MKLKTIGLVAPSGKIEAPNKIAFSHDGENVNFQDERNDI